MTKIERLLAKVLEPGLVVCDDPAPGVLRVGRDRLTKKPVYVEFLCPCGCGDRLQIDVTRNRDDLRSDRAVWHLAVEDGRPTLTPAVSRLDGCGSQFRVRHGDVLWTDSEVVEEAEPCRVAM